PDLRDKAVELSKNVWMIDEFLAQEMAYGKIQQSAFTESAKTVHLHTHCFQKALKVADATQKILGFPKNYTVKLIPSGCCGMAGSFGYEKEHFDISIAIGNMTLIPAL